MRQIGPNIGHLMRPNVVCALSEWNYEVKQVSCSRPIYGPDRPIDFAIEIAYILGLVYLVTSRWDSGMSSGA